MPKAEIRVYPTERLGGRLGILLSGVALIIALVWIFRSILFVSQYSVQIAYAFIVFVFLTNIIHVKLNQGFFGFLGSLASKLGSFAIDISIAFFFAGFLGLEQQFTNYTLALFIAGILLFIASFIFWRLVVPKRAVIGREVFSFGSGQIQFADDLKARAEQIVGLPITIGNRLLGCMSVNDVEFSVNTTFGGVKVPARAPVLILSRNLERKEKVRNATDEEYAKAEKLYAERKSQLTGTFVKLPFVNVEAYEDDTTEVEIGPLRVSDTDEGTIVDIPPFIHVIEEGGPRRVRVFVTSGDKERATIVLAKGLVKAIWNGWKLKTDGDTYTIVRKGGSYAKDRDGTLIVGSPGYELTVSSENVSIQLPDIELMATPTMLVLKSDGKTQRISNEKLSRRLIDAMVNVAKEQVSDLLSGAELDPADVYVEIDSLLHGVE